MEDEIKARLKAAQEAVKTLGARREQLNGDLRVAESQVAQSVAALRDLGIAHTDKLTIDDLRQMEVEASARLNTNLADLETQIKAANQVLAEYTAAVK